MMPLMYAEKDRPMTVCRISGPLKVRSHLADLGFSPQSLRKADAVMIEVRKAGPTQEAAA